PRLPVPVSPRLGESRFGGEEDVEARPFGERVERLLRRRLRRVLAHLAPADAAEGHADTRVQEAQVVVDFRLRADGRARVARRVLLTDGYGRRDAQDLVHVRLVHTFEELTRVSRKGFDVAPLPLGVDRVEGERRLARTR